MTFYVLSALTFLTFLLLGIEVIVNVSLVTGCAWFVFCIYILGNVFFAKAKAWLDLALCILYVIASICLASIPEWREYSNGISNTTLVYLGMFILTVRKY